METCHGLPRAGVSWSWSKACLQPLTGWCMTLLVLGYSVKKHKNVYSNLVHHPSLFLYLSVQEIVIWFYWVILCIAGVEEIFLSIKSSKTLLFSKICTFCLLQRHTFLWGMFLLSSYTYTHPSGMNGRLILWVHLIWFTCLC